VRLSRSSINRMSTHVCNGSVSIPIVNEQRGTESLSHASRAFERGDRIKSIADKQNRGTGSTIQDEP
jgi:hypothetical protein